MRICCVHCKLASTFQKLGHEVLVLNPGPGFYQLAPVLEKNKFSPDLLFQQETLGARTLIADLEDISCPRIYWSIDTHLNTFWQQYYARLFDLVLATQREWLPYLANSRGTKLGWLPWFGFKRPWTAWETRKYQTSFVGRITKHRPLRKNFTDFLTQDFKTHVCQEIPYQQMLGLYSNSKIVPNESILGEINFRLFEATSSGCLVCNQDSGQGLEELFVPGQEIMLFSHVLELKGLLNYFLKHSDQACHMAAAARERVQKEHLPQHRAEYVLKMAREISAKKLSHNDAQTALWLTALQLWDAGRLELNIDAVMRILFALPLDPELLASLMRLYFNKKSEAEILALLVPVLQKEQYAESWLVNLTGSHICLGLDKWEMACRFWLRYAYKQKKGKLERPRDAGHLYQLWAGELLSLGYVLRPGFLFDSSRHTPCSALDCLLTAYELKPKDLDLARQIDKLLSRYRGMESTRLGLLSYLSLQQPKDWKCALELGLVNLRAFRERQGLEELFLAQKRATEKQEQEKFLRSLSRRDKSGQLTRLFSSN